MSVVQSTWSFLRRGGVIDRELVEDLSAYQICGDSEAGYSHEKNTSEMNRWGSFTEALGRDAADDCLRIESRCRSALVQL